MTLNNFIAAVWAARLLSNLHPNLVAAQPGVVNNNYQGDVSAGNTVNINSIGPVTVGDYTKNADHSTPETLTDAQRQLLIDQAKFFNFQVDDIDKFQQVPKVMNEAMMEAAFSLANALDTFILGKYTDAAAGNAVGSTGTPVAVDKTNAYTTLLQMAVNLTKANIPTIGRWVIVPPEFTAALLDDDRFVSFGTGENLSRLQNGVVGRVAGFDVLESNNVVQLTAGDAGKYKILAGSPLGITLAHQIEEVEAYRPERRFADAVKGLHVYGAKAVRPTALGVVTATF